MPSIIGELNVGEGLPNFLMIHLYFGDDKPQSFHSTNADKNLPSKQENLKDHNHSSETKQKINCLNVL